MWPAVQMDTGLRLAVVVLLVVANGFFVAAEFALVTARKTRIEQLAARGNRAAIAVRRALDDPNRFISSCQLGITMASLALGWIGEDTIAHLLEPTFSALFPADFAGISAHGVSIALAFVIITFLHITLGEQVPKMLALQSGESSALFTVGPVNFIGFVFRPFIKLLEMSTNLVLRLVGVQWRAEGHQAYSTEDLKLMVRSSRTAAGFHGDVDLMVERALDFSQLSARQMMVPRVELVAVPAKVSLARFAELMRRHEHSRYPVYEDSMDNIVGILSAKRLAAFLASGPDAANNTFDVSTFDVRAHMSEPLFVPESVKADRLLTEMKAKRSHLAIVVDEYGVTAGLVTLRDVLDRIAGELPDESELTHHSVEWLGDGTALVDGLTLLADLSPVLGVDIPDDDYDTVGGLMFGELGRRPQLGDTVILGGRTLVVDVLDGLRVSRVRVLAGSLESPTVEQHQGR